MSDNHEEAHTGPIKTPKEFLTVVVLSFIVPIFVIIGLVHYISSQPKPAAGADNSAQAVASRLQKVGMVQLKDANGVAKTGEEVFKAQCSACHMAGAAGAPKFGDPAAWGPRIKNGYASLLNSALKGKNAMGPQGGGDHDDYEIARAVVYLANAGGAKFPEPAAPKAN
ncbi:MAG: cytochrome c5 family protein [Betaproteobacteria bacterium]|nr:cytochrome c5 family protein [Betaproteobacteria bacterium]